MPAELDLKEIIFGILGGLALFIYGMNLMSDSLQKAAGERMRRILEVLTGNPFIGVLVGALVTAVVQSSGATTVMVIGFVSARLMTLTQAIGVILGANIGTTITAQIVAFKLGSYAYVIAALGFVIYFLFKKRTIKYIGQSIFAFGLLFIGLNLMGDVMKPLAQSSEFASIMLRLNKNRFLGVLVGLVSTVLVQSSSAVIAVVQNIAAHPAVDGVHAMINLETAIPILFGSNIGSTVTALLASIGGKINAKRAAVAHFIFNIFGTLVFIWFIPAFAKLVKVISPKGDEVLIVSRQIANAHTSFNIVNTIIWLPFIWLMTKIVTFIVRGEDDEIEKRVLYLDNRMLNNPAIAMNLVTRELARMAKMAQQMMTSARQAFVMSNMEESKKVFEIEETIDTLQTEIVKYLSTMLSRASLTERQSIRLAGLMHITNDIERIGDHCENVAEFAEWKVNENIPFSQEALSEVADAFTMVNNMVDDSIYALHDGNIELAKKVLSEENEVDNLEERLRDRHLKRLNSGLCDPQAAVIFIELIHNLERIADHCNNVAEAVLSEYNIKPETI
ncbi:MAG TPA: Na/Pi cotransporter family protein [Clostridiales bacterium]|nr:Na/Pi cotransporter family protein [Clostridiales bacterium]